MASFSLREYGKKCVLENMVRSVLRGGSCSQDVVGMVVDDRSLRILSSFCKIYDILQEGVTVVELINKKRQCLPDLNVIYFISPDPHSVALLCEDFKNERKPQYRSVHVFFTSPIGKNSGIMETVASCSALLPRINSFVEMNFNFIVYEERIFHFDSPHLIFDMFPPTKTELLHEVADQLVSVCIAFGDQPIIRFLNNSLRLCEQLASIVHNKLNKMQLTKNQTTLVIVDRSIDVSALFIHEYCYQALAYDLIGIPVCSAPADRLENPNLPPDDSYEYEFTTNNEDVGTRRALLGDHDEVWVKYRHHHITTVNKLVREEVSRFARENAAAKLSKRQVMTSEETIKAVRALPQFQEMLAKYWAHVSMSERCYKELQDRKLMDVGGLEQDLATGVGRNGVEINPSKLISGLGSVLSNNDIGIEEKMRVLLLYFSNMSGIKDEERRHMTEAAQLSLDCVAGVMNFLSMGLHETAAEGADIQLTKQVHIMHHDQERLNHFQRRAKTAEFALSRYQPLIRDVMEKAAENQLSGQKFQFVVEPERRQITSKSKKTSLRAQNIEWDWGGSSTAKVGESSNKPHAKTIILFVLGGITMSEMRCTYEVSRQYGCDIFLGGNAILTPHSFLDLLKKQKKFNPI